MVEAMGLHLSRKYQYGVVVGRDQGVDDLHSDIYVVSAQRKCARPEDNSLPDPPAIAIFTISPRQFLKMLNTKCDCAEDDSLDILNGRLPRSNLSMEQELAGYSADSTAVTPPKNGSSLRAMKLLLIARLDRDHLRGCKLSPQTVPIQR